MRYGFTTGSCSAAGAKACAFMVLGRGVKENISIVTPAGITFEAQLVDITRGDNWVKAGVIKDGGDDPDVTSGYTIYSKVEIISDIPENANSRGTILLEGGEGVGMVTRPGLDQPVGNAAINSVPRKMIEDEVREVMEIFDFKGTLKIEISVPGGSELAEKTFNPRLGIKGGISILGTSGIVEPMSSRAILDTIKAELSQNYAEGQRSICISPGNYGVDFLKNNYDYDLNKAVKCSNYIGETIDMAIEFGYEKLLLCGHSGKLIKVSGGIMNTHSKEADARMELMAAAAVKAGADTKLLLRILECLTTDEAYSYIVNAGIEKPFMAEIMKKIMFYLEKRSQGKLQIECMVYSLEYGLLGASDRAIELLKELKS